MGTVEHAWISTKEHTFQDVTGHRQTVPPGTLWLTSKITNPMAMKLIQEKRINAYSATTTERKHADKYLELLQINAQKTSALKQDFETLQNIYEEQLSKKRRTLIKDFEDPVLWIVSLTDFPCVSQAKFCMDSYNANFNETSSNKSCGCETMTEESLTNFEKLQNFINSLKSSDEEPQNADGTTKNVNSQKAEGDPLPPENKQEEPKKEDENKLTLEKLNETLIKGFSAISESLESMNKKIDDTQGEQETKEDNQQANKSAPDEETEQTEPEQTETEPETKEGNQQANKSQQITPDDDGLIQASNPSYKGETDQQIINRIIREGLKE